MKPISKDHMGPMMDHCAQLLRRCLHEKIQQYGLTAVQGRCMMILACYGGIKQGKLAEILQVKPSTVNGIVERLEQKQLLRRVTAPEDGRCRTLELTEKGLRLQDAIKQCMAQTEKESRQGFTPEEEELLYQFLGRMINNLRGE